MKFDESNGSQVEQMPLDVGDKDPSEAIQDLSIGKIRPMEVKESTSSTYVEPPTSQIGEPQGNMEASTSGTHQDEEVQQEDLPQPPSPPPQDNSNNNEEEEEEDEDEEEAQPQPTQRLPRV